DRDQVAALLGEAVLEARWVLAVAAFLQDPLVDQRAEPPTQDVGCDSELLLHLIEAPPAECDLSQHQDRPTLAQERERLGDRTVLLGEGVDWHVRDSSHSLA